MSVKPDVRSIFPQTSTTTTSSNPNTSTPAGTPNPRDSTPSITPEPPSHRLSYSDFSRPISADSSGFSVPDTEEQDVTDISIPSEEGFYEQGPGREKIEDKEPIYDAATGFGTRFPQHDDISEKDLETKEEEQITWDAFTIRYDDDIDSSSEERWVVMSKKVLKVFVYILMFALMWGSVVIAKGTFLFAATNTKRTEETIGGASGACYCARYGPITRFNNASLTVRDECVCAPGLDNVELCPFNDDRYVQTGTFHKDLCSVVNIQWIWCVTLMLCTPNALIFIRCLWYTVFKHKKNPELHILGLIVIIETIHAGGLSMFAFLVVPRLDNAVLGHVLACGGAFLPGLMRIFNRPLEESAAGVQMVVDILAFIAQISALVLWPLMPLITGDDQVLDPQLQWAIPVSLLLISISWWENYVSGSQDEAVGRLDAFLAKFKHRIRQGRTKIYLIVSMWKCVMIMLFMMIFTTMDGELTVDRLFKFDWGSCNQEVEVTNEFISGLTLDWAKVWLINASCCVVAYFCARTTAKIRIQPTTYALALLLATPSVFGFLMGFCDMWNKNPCSFSNDIPSYFWYSCYAKDLFSGGADVMVYVMFYAIWVLWWLSQLWISRHIWTPSNVRLAKTERLFVTPMFEGSFLEQSLLYNRNRHDRRQASEKRDTEKVIETEMEKTHRKEDETPMIYICATMWHETEEEMINMLKSMFRLDIDQSARRNAQEFFKVEDPEFYQFEAHIFFDDSMQNHEEDDHTYTINDFVKQLVKVVDKAASIVHGIPLLRIKKPTKIPTPYGGRLVWMMPGGNRIIAHLKDNSKIRHKKRWSQVMYMYYFLGHKLFSKDLDYRRKQRIAENTFLLALDGDVDFEPIGLTLLVDLMKRSETVGAACGRIHPMGSGPMVWYQKFEYALGHWLQKSTEHVLGCVLCSPGCFSLFRGSALIDDNVCKTYTTEATEARHFVQYDQGEDRWLCTLLLQAGYRVEYNAASDSFTQSPEGLNEFYNQRRRWTPSTIANIMDLISTWGTTTARNEDISGFYMFYQLSMLISSLFGPGTIFLMIVGALEVATGGNISQAWSFFINFIPMAIFILMCFFAKTNTQLWFATILTAVYALLQMLVFVGILIAIAEDGLASPSSVFFFYIAGTFLLAAVLHPQEFLCVIHGLVYFLSIPSMYMLLMIYSVTNLHIVSWGTREVKPTQTQLQEEEQKKREEEEAAEKEARAALGVTSLNSTQDLNTETSADQSCSFALGQCFDCVCCGSKKDDSDVPIVTDEVRGAFEEIKNEEQREDEDIIDRRKEILERQKHDERRRDAIRHEMINPKWMEDESLGFGDVDELPKYEIMFFEELIERYLYPLKKDKAKEERVQMELVALKNKASAAFIMMNACFVVLISVLQMNVDTIHVMWPWGNEEADLRLEPIGVVFLIFFVSIMLVQTFGMLSHRLTTFWHIMSTTKISCATDGMYTTGGASASIELAKMMGQITIGDEDDIPDKHDRTSTVSSISYTDDIDEERPRERRKTMQKIQMHQDTKAKFENQFDTVNAIFKKNFLELQKDLEREGTVRITEKYYGHSKSTFSRNKSVNQIKIIKEGMQRQDSFAPSYIGDENAAYDPDYNDDDVIPPSRQSSIYSTNIQF